ncbi:DUF6804 family protein [Candidatus Ruminimicrobiellum ovillum]|uniref:DUF6804 family protein n=1 Tax=Candidatus Ruminimicrobiellum ovillum TaxID=1947927 RepID=UPI00355A1FCB
MKSIIKFLIIIDICLIAIIFYLVSINTKITKELWRLNEERFELVETYMKQNNLPTLQDSLVLSFLDDKEKQKRRLLQQQYDAIEKQIYQKEKDIINELENRRQKITNCLYYIEFSVFVLSVFLFLYFVFIKILFKKIDIKNNLNQIIPIIVSMIFLSLAIFEIDIIEEDAFYSLLKIIVSATLFYISLILKNSKSILFWLALSLGILFNPIVPIHLGNSDLWKSIDIFTIVYLFVYTVVKLRKKEEK